MGNGFKTDLGKRASIKRIVKAALGVASGATITSLYERLSPYGLAEQLRHDRQKLLAVQDMLNNLNRLEGRPQPL